MRTGRIYLALLGALVLTPLARGTHAAESKPVPQETAPSLGGLTGLLDVVGKLPNLSGLIQPEKMGLLTDNQYRVQDNQAKLLSENEADVSLLSGNVTKLAPSIRILSGLSVDVRIVVRSGDGKAASPKAAKGHGKKKSRKAGQQHAARTPEA